MLMNVWFIEGDKKVIIGQVETDEQADALMRNYLLEKRHSYFYLDDLHPVRTA